MFLCSPANKTPNSVKNTHLAHAHTDNTQTMADVQKQQTTQTAKTTDIEENTVQCLNLLQKGKECDMLHRFEGENV